MKTELIRLLQTAPCLLLLTAVLAAPAAVPPGRSQRLASPDAVPAGLSAADWSSIQQQLPPIAQQAYLKASNTGANDLR